jgi:hypothetical protein
MQELHQQCRHASKDKISKVAQRLGGTPATAKAFAQQQTRLQ